MKTGYYRKQGKHKVRGLEAKDVNRQIWAMGRFYFILRRVNGEWIKDEVIKAETGAVGSTEKTVLFILKSYWEKK